MNKSSHIRLAQYKAAQRVEFVSNTKNKPQTIVAV